MMNAVELGGVAKHLEAALENIGNDTAADEDVLRPDLRPFLTAELGEKARAGRAIIALAFARWRTLCRPDRANDIGPVSRLRKPRLRIDSQRSYCCLIRAA